MSFAEQRWSDPGVQPERTALAWQRTALALMIGPLVAVRLLAPSLEGLAVIAGLLGALGGIAVFFGARMRDRLIAEALAAGGGAPRLPGAGLLLLVSLGLAFGGAAALAVVLA